MSRFTTFVLVGLGRTLIGLGVLTLLFAGFQLWGTGMAEARAQSQLEGEFHDRLAALRADRAPEASPPSGFEGSNPSDPGLRVTVEEATVGPSTSAPPLGPEQLPEPGEAIGMIEIPAIGVTKTIVEGTSRDVLRSGPGHYGNTPLPGRAGNAAIAGHRTTHGAPFFDIDLLQPGDEIEVETVQGRFTYVVEGHDDGAGNEVGHFIVDPTEVGVIADKGDDRLTLTACHPKYSARQRIIVTAVMTSTPAPTPITNDDDDLDLELDLAELGEEIDPTNTVFPERGTGGDGPLEAELAFAGVGGEAGTDDGITESLGWQPDHAGPTALWAAMTALVALFGWLAGRFWRRWPAYAITVPPLALALSHCFTNLDKFIPAV